MIRKIANYSLVISFLCGLLTPFAGFAQDYVLEAESALVKRNYRMAVVYYHRALKNDPQDLSTLSSLAKSYELWGRLEKANQYALQALNLDENNIDSLLIVGRYLLSTHQTSEAISYFLRALDVDSGNKKAQTHLIEAYESQGRHAEAKQAMRTFESE